MATPLPGDGASSLDDQERSVLDRIAGWRERLVGRSVAWSGQNSGSDNLAGLELLSRTLGDTLARFDGEVETLALPDAVRIDARGDALTEPRGACLRLRLRPEAPVQVALTGHYDTVYPAGSRFAAVTPLADGRLNGPGIADMKGGISVMLGALEAFEAHPLAHRVGVQLLLSPDEETGSLGSAPLLADIGRGCHLGLTYEPALADGTLVSARKGSGSYHVVVRGRAAHAGRDFAQGRNALVTAARLATDLAALNGQRDAVTINIGRIDGGGALNTVPDRAVLRFNVRVPDAAAAAWIEAQLAELVGSLQGDGIAIEVHGILNRHPKPFLGAQRQLFEHVRHLGGLIGQAIRWQPSGGVCEGNNLFAQGLPGIDTLGVRGGDIHSEREYAWPDSFVERAQLSALILCRIAAGEIDGPALRARLVDEQGQGAEPAASGSSLIPGGNE